MNRQLLAAGAAVMALLLGVSACGSDGGDKAEPKATKTSASPSPSPTVPPQPKGAHGVTYEIENWEEYADDPAVLGYKQASEASSGSMNKHKLVPGIEKLLSKPVLHLVATNVVNGKQQGWSVPEVAYIRIESSRRRGNKARLVTCQWAPSTDVYDRTGELLGDVPREWRKYAITLKSRSGAWVLQPIKKVGTCPGDAPD